MVLKIGRGGNENSFSEGGEETALIYFALVVVEGLVRMSAVYEVGKNNFIQVSFRKLFITSVLKQLF